MSRYVGEAISKVLQGAASPKAGAGRGGQASPSQALARTSEPPTVAGTVPRPTPRLRGHAGRGCRVGGPVGGRRALAAGSGGLTGWGFAGPATLIVVGLSIFPAVWAFLISRQKWNGIAPATRRRLDATTSGWPGPDLCGRGRAHAALHRDLRARPRSSSGMLIAIALNRKIRLHRVLPHRIFVPFVASAAATGILANYVFNPQFGIANDAAAASSACRAAVPRGAGTRRCSSSA